MRRLKNLRVDTGKTQKEIADILGVDRTTYVKYENGNSEPNFEMLRKLSDLFDVSIDYLLEQKELPADDNGGQALSADEQLILKLYESLDDKDKAKAEGFLAALADQDKS